jgi:hypothetical protein
MAESSCALCGSEIDPDTGHTTVLTEEEQLSVGKQLDSFTYCNPCHALMQNPETASSLMSSMVEGHLRRLGVYTTPSEIERLKAKILDLALSRKTERPT